MVVFVCPLRACGQQFKRYAKLAEHWRRVHIQTVKLQRCVHCQQTFRTANKAASHIRQSGKQRWLKAISVTNRQFIDPGSIKFQDFKTEKTPREIAAEERRAKANVPQAEVLYGRSGIAVNRDEEAVMLQYGQFMRQRKVSERKRHLLLSPAEPAVLDYFDEYMSGDMSE